MFPPLCYIDATYVLPEEGKQQLMDTLSGDEYKLLTYANENTSVKIKFKIVEWWQNRRQPIAPHSEPPLHTIRDSTP